MTPSTSRAWERWLDAAGPWRGWSQCPALLSPAAVDVRPIAHRHATRVRRLGAQLEAVLGRGGVACALDLEPSLGVALAAELQVRRLAHPVLVLPRWPYAEAVLPGNELLYALLRGARRVAAASERSSNVVFVLDGERAILLPDRPPDDPRADNRHWLSSADLPNLATLRARGIRQVIKVAHGST